MEDDIIDFMPGYTEDAACWDEQAERDEIHAAAAVPKHAASNIFVKLPPTLATCDFDGKLCVDLGCGYGRTLIYSNLIARPLLSIGADISIVMLKKARKYSRQYSINPILIRADVSCLPLQTASVDLIYSTAVLIHLPKQKVPVIVQEIARLLKPGGRAVLENSFAGWLHPDGLQLRILTGLLSSWLKPAWVRTYTYGEVCQLFTSGVHFGSVDVRPDGYNVLPKALIKYSFPGHIKRAVDSFNQSASKNFHFKSLFVSGWTVTAQR